MTESSAADLAQLLRAANDVVDSAGTLWQLFRSYRRVAVQARITVSMTAPAGPTPINDNMPAPIEIVYLDQDQAPTTQLPPNAGALTLDTDNHALATIGADASGNPVVNVTSGWESITPPTFHVVMSSPFQATSEDIQIDPTVATSATIRLTAGT